MRDLILNNKGGVGKTLVTVSLAESLAHLGKRVLVVDLDPQANATDALRVQPERTLAECLSGTVSNGAAAGYVQPCGWSNELLAAAGILRAGGVIDVLPAELALEDITMQAGLPGSHMRLRRALFGVDDGYDVTIIDCPPSMGHLTANGLAALDDCDHGDTAIVPLSPDRRAISGALRAQAFIDVYAADLGVCAKITGLIVNKVRGTTTHGGRLDQLAATFPGVPVLGSPIPLRAAVDRLVDQAEPLGADRGPEASGVRETFDAIATHLMTREVVPA